MATYARTYQSVAYTVQDEAPSGKGKRGAEPSWSWAVPLGVRRKPLEGNDCATRDEAEAAIRAMLEAP